ncbi:hypothetical protein ACM720_06985 [Neisseria sp. LNP16475]
MQAAFYFSDGLHQRLQTQVAFQTTCNRKIRSNLLPLPWERAGEKAFSKLQQSFLIPSPPKYKPCGLLPSL